LSEKTGEKIINAGRSGDTTEDALKRIEEDVLSLDPKLVLIEFGGNDFMQNFPQETTKHNLERMIDLIQKKGAVVILIAVPSISGSFNDVFKNIAKNKKCAYIPNILKGIMARPNLMIDQIHPNENGNKIVADKIYKVLKPVLEEMKK
jgi:acyl-CoA hydrolase